MVRVSFLENDVGAEGGGIRDAKREDVLDELLGYIMKETFVGGAGRESTELAGTFVEGAGRESTELAEEEDGQPVPDVVVHNLEGARESGGVVVVVPGDGPVRGWEPEVLDKRVCARIEKDGQDLGRNDVITASGFRQKPATGDGGSCVWIGAKLRDEKLGGFIEFAYYRFVESALNVELTIADSVVFCAWVNPRAHAAFEEQHDDRVIAEFHRVLNGGIWVLGVIDSTYGLWPAVKWVAPVCKEELDLLDSRVSLE